MLNIPYNPKAFIFTSYLLDIVEIVSDAPSVKIGVKCDDELVFTATFYPYAAISSQQCPPLLFRKTAHSFLHTLQSRTRL